MRLGVLDIGSNTGHLLVVDAHAGAAPLPASSHKEPLRLAEHLTDAGAVGASGIDALVAFCADAVRRAEDLGCVEISAFATSAVREATNSVEVLDAVHERTGLALTVLPGEDEARLTFLAVRRWFGWSSGRLAVLDIGGGSLEVAVGADEAPDVARSMPLGAGRLSRDHLPAVPPDPEDVRRLRRDVRACIAREAAAVLRTGAADHAVGTSKTFRSLARICGAAPSADGPRVRRALDASALEQWIPRLQTMSLTELRGLPGVAPGRAHQVLAGALVASAAMEIFGHSQLEICPWALREGVLLDRLDKMSVLD